MNVMSVVPAEAEIEGEPSMRRRGASRLRKHRWFLLFVALPTLLATIYYGFIASDQFISESRFVVKSPSQRGGQVSTIASLIQTTGLSRGQEETNAVMDYVRSRNALVDLQKRVGVRSMFATPDADRLSRYPFPGYRDRFENLYDFFGDRVETHLDNETGLAVLNVRTFSPSEAKLLNATLLNLSEDLVNRLNERAQRQAISESLRRVQQSQDRVRAVRVRLAYFRNTQDLIDPEKQATGIFEIVTRLTGEKAALQAQLDQMEATTPNNPGIRGLRSRIAAVNAAIAGQSGRVVGPQSAIASKLGPYENLMLEQELATQALTAATAALEMARTDAQKQQFYLERVVEPNTPDLSRYPRRLRMILTIFAASLCLYLVGWMLIVGILEHAPED